MLDGRLPSARPPRRTRPRPRSGGPRRHAVRRPVAGQAAPGRADPPGGPRADRRPRAPRRPRPERITGWDVRTGEWIPYPTLLMRLAESAELPTADDPDEEPPSQGAGSPSGAEDGEAPIRTRTGTAPPNGIGGSWRTPCKRSCSACATARPCCWSTPRMPAGCGRGCRTATSSRTGSGSTASRPNGLPSRAPGSAWSGSGTTPTPKPPVVGPRTADLGRRRRGGEVRHRHRAVETTRPRPAEPSVRQHRREGGAGHERVRHGVALGLPLLHQGGKDGFHDRHRPAGVEPRAVGDRRRGMPARRRPRAVGDPRPPAAAIARTGPLLALPLPLHLARKATEYVLPTTRDQPTEPEEDDGAVQLCFDLGVIAP